MKTFLLFAVQTVLSVSVFAQNSKRSSTGLSKKHDLLLLRERGGR